MTNENDIKKIREMMEFLVKDKISDKIGKLSSDEKKIYELTDGRNQSEMAKSTGFSAGKVSLIWQRLGEKGILIKEGQKYKKVV